MHSLSKFSFATALDGTRLILFATPVPSEKIGNRELFERIRVGLVEVTGNSRIKACSYWVNPSSIEKE